MNRYKIEVCIDSIDSAINSQKGGAARVELCDNMFEGGTTPSAGNIKVCRDLLNIDLNIIIRPRGGDFYYSENEFNSMKYDIEKAKELGCNGVVFGILNRDGSIDKKRCKELVELSKPMSCTFHRAFDVCNDPLKSLESLIELGFDRVLTSGQESSVLEGIDLLKELIDKAGDRIIIMPGCGITQRNFKKIDSILGASEYHVRLNDTCESKMHYRSKHVYMGSSVRNPEFFRDVTSVEKIKSLF